MNRRDYVPRIIFQQMKSKYQCRIRLEMAFVWLISALVFILFLYFGSFSLENQEVFYFRDHANTFLQRIWQTSLIVIPALFAIILVSWGTLLLEQFRKKVLQKIESSNLPHHHKQILSKLCVPYYQILIVFSTIPPFITAVFFIQWLQLDTINHSNPIYAIICLFLFNLDYSYQRLSSKFEEAMRSSPILFARSLGIHEKSIWRHYVLPNLIRDYCTILRELLPHLIVESAILEYTFGYDGLMRSALESIRYNSWHYCMIFVFALVLFATFFNLLFRYLEDYLDPREG